MTALTEQESKWVDDLAGRLRLIQAGAATATTEKRREYLQEEVSRQFKDVPPANRRRFLTALMARFPVSGRLAYFAAASAPTAPAPAAVEETPEKILERFIAASEKLPEERRTEMAQRLAQHGFAWFDRDALVVEISEDLRQKLGLPAEQQVHLTRLIDLALFLTDTLTRLDQRALATLRELAPKSTLLKRQQDFRAIAGRYLANTEEQLEPHSRAITALLGALMAASLAAGKEFGRQHTERFSPAAIEAVIATEGGSNFLGFGKNKGERCWDKYAELANDYVTTDVIDKQIKDCMARFVERIFASQ